MKVHRLQLGELRSNCYIIETAPNRCVAVDIGGDSRLLLEFLKMHRLTLTKILLTHGHFDHTGGIEALQRRLGLPVYIHENGAAYLSDTRLNLSAVCGEHVVVHGAKYFRDGATFALQGHASPVLRAIHTPGHTPDSTTFYDAEDGIAFVGDTIFRGSIGNDQYPGGNRQQLLASIRGRIFTLPEDTVLYSGHSVPTTVKIEKQRYGL